MCLSKSKRKDLMPMFKVFCFFFCPVLSDCELAPRMERFQNPLHFLFKILLMHPTALRARGKCQKRGGIVGQDQSGSLFSAEVDD